MLNIGKNITLPGDALQPTQVEKVYKAIINPKGRVAEMVGRLQHIRAIDPKKYRKMKTALPYIVCAKFHPNIRRKENFMTTERFIVDIDHLSEFNINVENLKEKLKKDNRVEMFFTSPSGDGIKALFHLSEKISDAAYYSLFYKTFCMLWGKEYDLGGALDTVTSDVSRCCFVSYDPNAWYNPKAETISSEQYLNKGNFLEMDRIQKEVKEHEQEKITVKKEVGIDTTKKPLALSDDILNQIKEKVGQRVKQPIPKEYFQPEELEPLVDGLQKVFEEVGLKLALTEPIHYGRKVKVSAEKYWAELNIFYGQKGPTVVKTSKTGSNPQLVETVYVLIKDYFNHL